jgi:hypothetical protein
MLNEDPPYKTLTLTMNQPLPPPPPPGTHAELMRRLRGTGLQIPYRADDICKFIRIAGENEEMDRRNTIYPTRRMFPRHQIDYDWIIRNTEIPRDHSHLIPKPSVNPKLQETYYKLYAKDKETGCSWIPGYLNLREEQIRIYLWVFGVSFRSRGSNTASAVNPQNQLDSLGPSDVSTPAGTVSSFTQGQAIHGYSKLQLTKVTNITSSVKTQPRMSSSNVPCSSRTSKTVPVSRKLTRTLKSSSTVSKSNKKRNDELKKMASIGILHDTGGVASASGSVNSRPSSSQKQKTLSKSTSSIALSKTPPLVESVRPTSCHYAYVTKCDSTSTSNNAEILCNDVGFRDPGISMGNRRYSALSTWSFMNETNQSRCSSVEALAPSTVPSNPTSCSTSSTCCSCTSYGSSSSSGSWFSASTSSSHVNDEHISSKDASTMTEPEVIYLPKSKDVATCTSDIECSHHETNPNEDAIIVPGTPEQEHSSTLIHLNSILSDEEVIPATPE